MRTEHYVEMIDQIPAEIRPLVPGFLDRREKEITEARDHLDKPNFTALQDLGHKLKGTGSGYGLDVMTDIGTVIEAAARARDLDQVARAIDKLAEATRRLKQVLRDRKTFR